MGPDSDSSFVDRPALRWIVEELHQSRRILRLGQETISSRIVQRRIPPYRRRMFPEDLKLMRTAERATSPMLWRRDCVCASLEIQHLQ